MLKQKIFRPKEITLESPFENPSTILYKVIELKLDWTKDTHSWFLNYRDYRLDLVVNDLVWPFVRVHLKSGIRLGDVYVSNPSIVEEITGCRPKIFLSTVTSLSKMWREERDDNKFRNRADREWKEYHKELTDYVFHKLNPKEREALIEKWQTELYQNTKDQTV